MIWEILGLSAARVYTQMAMTDLIVWTIATFFAGLLGGFGSRLADEILSVFKKTYSGWASTTCWGLGAGYQALLPLWGGDMYLDSAEPHF